MASRLSSNWVSLAPLGLALAVLALGLVAFGARVARRGMPRTERVVRQGGSVFFGQGVMEFLLFLAQPVVDALVRLRISPDALSWSSLWIQAVAALFIARGAFGVGAWFLIIGAGCDSLDGAVARARGVSSDAGEVLDAAVDRWAEMGLFFAYGWYYRDFFLGFALCAVSCMGAVMVSYARAKGEALGVDAKMGLMQRHERAACLAVTTLLSPLAATFFEPGSVKPRHYLVLAALGLIALFATLTSIQRTAFTRAELRKQGR